MDSALNALQEALLRPELRTGKAYHVADARGLVKLDAMENPYGLPEALRSDWLARLREAPLNRYPDPRPQALLAALARHGGIPESQELMLGNGSDELIQLLILAVAHTGRPVLALEPSFVMYRIIAEHFALPFVSVPLDDDFRLDLSRFLEEMAAQQPAIVFIDWPNNPSGQCLPEEDLEAIVAAAPGLVVVDEAYHPFSGLSFAPRLGRYPNLLLLRTLSKEGLAGLRLGYLAGPKAWIEVLDRLRLPYNINILSQLSLDFFLTHAELLAEQAEAICRERERLTEALRELHVQVWPSRANFLLFRLPGRAAAIYEGLRERGVLIRAFTGHPRLSDHLRVSVGTPAENDRFLSALEGLL
ncbi:histidinol-phosphate transaminase [Acidithiobacillus sp.]|uniref:histidinol-phosphate transaminase n=1 Tax=Acidithiobacillus sp. TaxID=1872118 RepID=UPI0025BE117E|nr:histidinol-phosphate transaminase [Acidithiobacillus sp.]